MNPLTSTTLRLVSVFSAASLIGIATASPGQAATSGDVKVVNTETVQVYTDATGKPDTRRIYEQLALSGQGSVSLKNPVTSGDLRNLDGFGGLTVKDGEQVVDLTVDGEQKLRSVSDYKGKLPLEVAVDYKLDGKTVKPGDVVGKSGKLDVTYQVENITGESQSLTFSDGNGGKVTRNVDVPLPIVGSLTTVAPAGFKNVTSKQANMAGDGKGGTKLSFTMTLFPPIGSTTATFGYTADVVDGVVPRADITALPVNPLMSPTFKTAASSYQGGAQSGADLLQGATTIDTNLLKLRDGASELLAGLIQLRDGADQLRSGLVEKAEPGARKLADGAGKLDDGAGKLDDGAGKLAGGTGKAYSGSKDLSSGLARLSNGLKSLSDTQTGLPKAKAGIKQLQDGVDVIRAGFGDSSNPATLLGGLAALEGGLGQLQAGQVQVVGGLEQVADNLPAAKGGVDQVKSGLDSALSGGGSLDQLAGGLGAVKSNFCATHPNQADCDDLVNQLLAGVQDSRTNLTQASGGLGQVSSGLSTAIGGLNSQLIPGAKQVRDGLASAQSNTGKIKAGGARLDGGVQLVADGLDQLSVGVAAAVGGAFQLSDGAATASNGGADLSDGLGLIDGGANDLADGTGQLSDGTGQLKDGAGQLSSGLGDAASGSGRLADGLGTAAGGAPKLVDGADRLSAEGTKKLIEAGSATAENYGELYASMKAGAKRATVEDMAVGAPADAVGLTAYSFVIQGEDGEGDRNLSRGLGGLTLLGLGSGLFALRRRFI